MVKQCPHAKTLASFDFGSKVNGELVTDKNVNQKGEFETTSLSLIQRAQARDPSAWGRLLNLYEPLLLRWCVRAGLQAADAADVKQDVLTAVTRSISDFRRDRPGDSFRGWLYAITRNKIRDRLRKLKEMGVGGSEAQQRLALIAAEEFDSGNSEAPPPEPGDQQTLYLRAMDLIRCEFEPKTWDAFWRVTVDGRLPADVAEELCMSPNAVYLARSRIIRRLRDEFEGVIDSDSGRGPPSRPPLREDEG